MPSERPGSTRRYRKIRRFVIDRDGCCQLRIPGVCTGGAQHAHHIHGWTRCPQCRADNPAHMMASCAACNLHVGDPGRGAEVDPAPKRLTDWRRHATT